MQRSPFATLSAPSTRIASACLAVALLTAGCGNPHVTTAPGGYQPTPGPAYVTASAMRTQQQVFPDGGGPVLAPLAAGTAPRLSAEQVRLILLKKGNLYLGNPAELTVRLGLYLPLAHGSRPPQPVPAAQGVISYVFSGGSGPCPTSIGGLGTPAPTTIPLRCRAVIVADASTGEELREQI